MWNSHPRDQFRRQGAAAVPKGPAPSGGKPSGALVDPGGGAAIYGKTLSTPLKNLNGLV